MFTGIVEGIGRVLRRDGDETGARLEVEVPFPGELAVGESVAVDGCCLTALAGEHLVADLSPETLSRTQLGARQPGDRVNLERAITLADRLGGHVVQGHVDRVARVLAVEEEGEGRRLRFELSERHRPFLVPKGSVTVDGVSLTVAALAEDSFDVALVPHTLAVTTLADRRVGDRVNVEHDLVGKYLLRCLGLSGRVDLPPDARRELGLE